MKIVAFRVISRYNRFSNWTVYRKRQKEKKNEVVGTLKTEKDRKKERKKERERQWQKKNIVSG